MGRRPAAERHHPRAHVYGGSRSRTAGLRSRPVIPAALLTAGGWAALYMMFQPYIEAVLDRHDKALPDVEVRQGVTVSEIEQDGEAVTLRGVGADGKAVSIRANYAVGADGGNGFTRKHLCDKVDDYGFEKSEWTPWSAYGQSKMVNIYMANEIERRSVGGCSIYVTHPRVFRGTG